jgi:Na+/melibiose symporter-like transporter
MASFSIWHWLAVALLVMCAVTPLVAYWKNRPVFLWFALGVMLNPIAFVVLLFLPKQARPPYVPPAAAGEPRIIE